MLWQHAVARMPRPLTLDMQIILQVYNSPVAPLWDPHSLNDVHSHLEEKNKEEEKEAEGTVRPGKKHTTQGIESSKAVTALRALIHSHELNMK